MLPTFLLRVAYYGVLARAAWCSMNVLLKERETLLLTTAG